MVQAKRGRAVGAVSVSVSGIRLEVTKKAAARTHAPETESSPRSESELMECINPQIHPKLVKIMKRAEAKIVANTKESPASEPDEDPNTWLIEAKLDEDVFEWENVRLDFRGSEIKAEIVETAMTEPTRCTVRTRGQSPLKKGDHIHVDIREQKEL